MEKSQCRIYEVCGYCNNITQVNQSQLEEMDLLGRVPYCSDKCLKAHRTLLHKGIRSKFEIYVEQRLKCTYPELEVVYNSREIVGLELDIYIPYLNLAIEINGIFHYKPIHGNDGLLGTQRRDARKQDICKKLGIKLMVVDIASMKVFNKRNADPFLKQVFDIINDSAKHFGDFSPILQYYEVNVGK